MLTPVKLWIFGELGTRRAEGRICKGTKGLSMGLQRGSAPNQIVDLS